MHGDRSILWGWTGGRISSTDGGRDVFAQPPSMLASEGLIHEAMLGVLRGE